MRVNLTQAANITGLTRKTVRKHIDLAKIEPVDRKGRIKLYDSAAVLQAIPAETLGNISGRTLYDENIRLRASQANRSETAHQKELENLLDADEVQRTWEDLVLVTRARMLVLPSAVAPSIAAEGGDINGIIRLLDGAVRHAVTSRVEEAPAEIMELGDVDDGEGGE